MQSTTSAPMQIATYLPHVEDSSPAWTIDALSSVWEHQRDRVSERIALIERATAALAGENLDPEILRDARRAAHMLAGSVGMFGFMDASDAAHEIEVQLEHPTPSNAPALSALARRLRSGVQGSVTGPPTLSSHAQPGSHSTP